MPTQTKTKNSGSSNDLHRDDSHCCSSDVSGYLSRGAEQMQDAVRENAGRSVFIAMAAGLGVGLLIGSALAGSRRSSTWWDRSTAEGLGRRLLDRVEGFVPDALSERLGRQ